MVEALLRFVKASGTGSTDAELVVEVDTLDSLARATESASVERALLAHVLKSGDLTDEQRQREAIRRRAGLPDLPLRLHGRARGPRFYSSVPGTLGAVAAVRAGTGLRGGARRHARGVVRGSHRPHRCPARHPGRHGRHHRRAGLQHCDPFADRGRCGGRDPRRPGGDGRAGGRRCPLDHRTAAPAAGAALQTADGLPALVSRIQSDGPAVIRNVGDAVQPEGKDEIGQVANAFNEVHSTAVQVAGEQALLRQNLDTIVVNLSRRTQSLVDRQLGEIEISRLNATPTSSGRCSASTTSPPESGDTPRACWSSPASREMAGTLRRLLDVVRTAVGEVEQYPRVKFGVMPDLVTPAAVDDVAHLLAELLDNATEFGAVHAGHDHQPALLGGGPDPGRRLRARHPRRPARVPQRAAP